MTVKKCWFHSLIEALQVCYFADIQILKNIFNFFKNGVSFFEFDC